MPTKPKQKRRPWEPKPATRQAHARRVNPNHDFYNSRRWRKVSKRYLQSHPFCECDECKTLPVPLPAQVVDHKRRINEGGDPWNENNFQAMNSRCHNRKSGKEAH
jgi:5-methylcytosine-specific restriction protein A